METIYSGGICVTMLVVTTLVTGCSSEKNISVRVLEQSKDMEKSVQLKELDKLREFRVPKELDEDELDELREQINISMDGNAKRVMTIHEVKSQAPSHSKWLEHEYDDHKFLFCDYSLPRSGAWASEIQVWVNRPSRDEWHRVLVAQLTNVGELEFVTEQANRVVVVKSKGENKLKGKPLLSVDVEALK